jgi:hypothetical protein
MTTFICQECGKEYHPFTLLQKKFCSNTCRQRYWNRKTREKYQLVNHTTKHKVCPVCGSEFEAPRSNYKYCSVDCKRFTHQLRHILMLHPNEFDNVIKFINNTIWELDKNA